MSDRSGPVVAVIRGGRSSEHDISLLSGEAVAGALVEAGFEVVVIEVTRDGRWLAEGNEMSLTPGTGLAGIDVAFPVLHGPFGEDGATQGVLETVGIPYVGSDVLGSAICMDKLTLKRLCDSQGIAQVEFVQVGDLGWRERALSFGLPLWVKPSRLGSSVGISKVESADLLERAVAVAVEHDPRVIIEANCEGREVECSVLGNEEPEASVPGEILTRGDWYDFESKYSEGGMELAVPTDLPDQVTEVVREMAIEVFRLAGCSGMARCDFFVTGEGGVLLNEVNTIPGFTSMSVYARLWEASGIAYPELCRRLVDFAFDHHRENRTHSF